MPHFSFTDVYCLWYDYDNDKWQTDWYHPDTNSWDESIIYVLPGDTVYFGCWISNQSGETGGTPVFRVEKSTGGNIMRIQSSFPISGGDQWSAQQGWTYDGNIQNYLFLACSLEGGVDYIHDQVGPPYLRLMPLSITKEHTTLTCYDRTVQAGNTVELKARLMTGSTPIEGGTISFWRDDTVYIGAGITDSTGYASKSWTPAQSQVGAHTYQASFAETDEYYSSSCEGDITVTGLPTACTYSGHACDGEVDMHSLPSSANEGDVVEATFKIDNLCYTPNYDTRYRVKFVLNDGSPAYSVPFTLTSVLAVKDVDYSFTMPDANVVLKVTVQRCNESGNWETAGDTAYSEYTVTLSGGGDIPTEIHWSLYGEPKNKIAAGVPFDISAILYEKSHVVEWNGVPDVPLHFFIDDEELSGSPITTDERIGNQGFAEYRGVTISEVGRHTIAVTFEGSGEYMAASPLEKEVSVEAGAVGEIKSYPDPIPSGFYDLWWDYHLTVGVKNSGQESGEFQLRIWKNSDYIGHAPFLGYTNIKPGATETFKADISKNLGSGDIVRLELWEEDAAEYDDFVEIPVGGALDWKKLALYGGVAVGGIAVLAVALKSRTGGVSIYLPGSRTGGA